MPQIDLNADLGESYGPWTMGEDAKMLSIVTSANIACGGHAGDANTMVETTRIARENGVKIGAHPGYADREGFGRRIIPMTKSEISNMVATQIGALRSAAALSNADVVYVKPHGMLNNFSCVDEDTASAIVHAVKAAHPDLAMLAISGTLLETHAKDAGLTTFSEIFADRGYTEAGTLVSRDQPGAMITCPDEAANRLTAFAKSGRMPTISGDDIALEAHSICVHGDSAHAVAMAARVRDALSDDGITVTSFL
ncbi:MAG: 5-oxoprolinase subunit PxpA [Litoreibacter sp.]